MFELWFLEIKTKFVIVNTVHFNRIASFWAEPVTYYTVIFSPDSGVCTNKTSVLAPAVSHIRVQHIATTNY